ncbi:MAG: GntR family transcriptional regulator [Clostridia bacterium]
MKWQFESDRAIYIQIKEILKADIIANNYEIGQKFPSVRELAQLASVNPNTMQKALVELEKEGFLESSGTLGRVISKNYGDLNTKREDFAKKKTDEYVAHMKKIGYSEKEIINLIMEVGKNVVSGN